MFGSIAFFTGNALIIRGAEADAWSAVLFRGVVGLIVTAIIFRAGGGFRPVRMFTRPLLIVRGVLGATGLGCFYWTIGKLGAGPATLVCQTYILFASVFAALVLKERLPAMAFIWLVVALGGVGLLQAGGSNAGGDLHWVPVGVGLFGALASGSVVVCVRALHRSEGSGTIFAAQCCYAIILSLPLAWSRLGELSPASVAILSGAACLAAGGQLLLTLGFRYLSVASGGAPQMILCASIAGGGFLFFGETYSAVQLAGALLIVAGSTMAGQRGKNAPESDKFVEKRQTPKSASSDTATQWDGGHPDPPQTACTRLD